MKRGTLETLEFNDFRRFYLGCNFWEFWSTQFVKIYISLISRASSFIGYFGRSNNFHSPERYYYNLGNLIISWNFFCNYYNDVFAHTTNYWTNISKRISISNWPSSGGNNTKAMNQQTSLNIRSPSFLAEKRRSYIRFMICYCYKVHKHMKEKRTMSLFIKLSPRIISSLFINVQ